MFFERRLGLKLDDHGLGLSGRDCDHGCDGGESVLDDRHLNGPFRDSDSSLPLSVGLERLSIDDDVSIGHRRIQSRHRAENRGGTPLQGHAEHDSREEHTHLRNAV